MYQVAPTKTYTDPVTRISGKVLKALNKLCYFSSVLSNSGSLDDKIVQQIFKSSVAFYKLAHYLWKEWD